MLVRYQTPEGPRLGILAGGVVRTTSLTDADWPHELKRLAEGGRLRRHGRAVEKAQILPPITATSRILCVAQNYPAHAAEAGGDSPPTPIVFLKPSSAFVGDADKASIPAVSDFFDYEGELAVVIGRSASKVSVKDAMDRVAGYSIGNDGSARDLQPATLAGRIQIDWFAAKSTDRGSALGPGVVPRVDVEDVGSARLTTVHNGETVQDDVVSSMYHSIPELIAFVSSILTLEPGDVILTGTPAGVGKARGVALEHGDSIVVSITGVGDLRTTYTAYS